MNKRAQDYAMIMLFVVIVALPVLYIRMTSKMQDTKETIGEAQAMLLRAPYDKEDTINYAEKAASLALPDILKELQLEIPAQNCDTSIYDTIKETFNKHLDVYIKDYNKKSFTKIPENNYEIYIEGNQINAIAVLPVKKLIAKPGTELTSIGTMWFAPSFTITATIPEYQATMLTIEAKKQSCATT